MCKHQNKEKALFRHHCNKYWLLQGLEICRIGILFPIYSLCYVVCPWANFSQSMRKPFIKFICNSASYFFFLCKSFISILFIQLPRNYVVTRIIRHALLNFFVVLIEVAYITYVSLFLHVPCMQQSVVIYYIHKCHESKNSIFC